MMVDAGGGAFLRFGQARANLADLLFFGVSHLHPDHTSDLPALLWRSQTLRSQPLNVAGPSASESAPDIKTFLDRLFDERIGAFQVMGPAVGGKQGAAGGSVRLEPTIIDATRPQAITVFDSEGLRVTAIGIPHFLPTVAYRVQVAGRSVVFSSDQNGTNPSFAEFARDADLLLMHLQLGVGASSPGHATPAVVGQVASAARARRLVLGHIGQFDLDAAVAEVKKWYAGPITVGADLQCTPLD
jgi:ribonuclease BN (tRNA processing enzyme)